MARYGLERDWRNAPLMFGGGMVAHCLATLTAARLLMRVRSRFYACLLLVVFCGMIDLTLTALAILDTQLLSAQRVIWFIVSWVACCGFTVHNYMRLCALLRGKQLRMRWPLAVVTATPVILYTIYTIQLLYAVIMNDLLPLGKLLDPSKTCDVWACVDAVANSIISGCFVFALNSMGGAANGGIELRPGYNRLLYRVKTMLTGETILIVAPTAASLIVPSFDPIGLTMFLAQGLRLLVYCNFLDTLNIMLTRPSRPAHTAGSQSLLLKSRSQVKLTEVRR